jgi:hypothetical protein
MGLLMKAGADNIKRKNEIFTRHKDHLDASVSSFIPNPFHWQAMRGVI